MSRSNTEVKKLISYDEEGEKGSNFEPIPYTFKVPNKYKKIGESSIISPPNWLLLDHTIAVIWSLFSTLTPNKALDIDDLEWAHEFLKHVRNAKGDHPPDVKTCLMEIQDRLIALYAQLNRTKEDNPTAQMADETIPLSRQKTNSIEIPKVTDRRDSKVLKAHNNESLKDIKSESNGMRKQIRDASIKESKKSLNQQRRVSTPLKNSPMPIKRSEIPKKETGKKDGDAANFFTEVFQRNRTNDRVLGAQTITNPVKKKTISSQQQQSNEIISNVTRKDLAPDVSEDGKISLEFKRWLTEEELNNEEQAYINLKNEIQNLMKNPKISKDEVWKFLSNWREEQVERLQSELKRLDSIEEFMKSVKMEGFVPYVQDDLAQRLRSITSKKITNKLSRQ